MCNAASTLISDLFIFVWKGKQIRSYEALDGKNPITAVTTMPPPHCSVVFASADSILRFIDPRKPGLQVHSALSNICFHLKTYGHYIIHFNFKAALQM